MSLAGVLLLNACLTVRAANANSHKDKGWEQFTDAVVSWINNNMSGVVFILWGSYAQKKGAKISAVSICRPLSEPSKSLFGWGAFRAYEVLFLDL